MARTMIVNTTMNQRNEANEMKDFVAFSATDGAEIKMATDEKQLILLKNEHATAEKTVTVKAGDGAFAGGDLVFSVKAGKTYALVLESGKFGVLSGADGGKILMEADADVKMCVVELP